MSQKKEKEQIWKSENQAAWPPGVTWLEFFFFFNQKATLDKVSIQTGTLTDGQDLRGANRQHSQRNHQ